MYSLAASFRSVLLHEPPQEALQRLESDRLYPLAKDATLNREFAAPFLQSIDRARSLLPQERFESAEAWLAALAAVEVPPDPWDENHLLQEGKRERARMLKFVDGAP